MRAVNKAPSRYNPWLDAVDLNVRVITRPLPIDMLGCWHFPSRTVVLSKRLSQIERRCTLAHELVHVERGDTGPCVGQERAVHAVAAARLIPVEDLALAFLLHAHEQDQARELWVDLATLRTRVAELTDTERAFVEGRPATVTPAAAHLPLPGTSRGCVSGRMIAPTSTSQHDLTHRLTSGGPHDRT